MKVLVTGGTGFIGGETARSLAEAGHEVVVTTRAADWRQGGDMTVVSQCDLAQPASLALLPTGINAVVHAAALADFRHGTWHDHLRNNVGATRNILRWAERSGVAHLAFMSTIGVHDRPWGHRAVHPLDEQSPRHPSSAYGRSKVIAEDLVAAARVPTTTLRLSWVYGTGMRSNSHIRAMAGWGATNALARHAPVTGRVSVIDVRDVAAAVKTILETGGDAPDTGAILLAESEPAELRHILNPAATILKRPAGPLARSVAALLPLSLRALVDDSLVCNPERMRMLGLRTSHAFYDEFPLLLDTEGWLP